MFRRDGSKAESDALVPVVRRVPDAEKVQLLLDHLHRRLDSVAAQPQEHNQVRLSGNLLPHQEQKVKRHTGDFRREVASANS